MSVELCQNYVVIKNYLNSTMKSAAETAPPSNCPVVQCSLPVLSYDLFVPMFSSTCDHQYLCIHIGLNQIHERYLTLPLYAFSNNNN